MLCQPSLIEPLGQALLEAMACGRSVVATRIGGPPEFVPPEAGVLVDPLDVEGIAAAMRQAAGVSRGRTRLRARPQPGTTCAVRPSGSRRSSGGRWVFGRSAILISTSGRIVSSSPASRAASSACSQLSRAFCGSTPCFSRLSPVTRSFWIRSWASASPVTFGA